MFEWNHQRWCVLYCVVLCTLSAQGVLVEGYDCQDATPGTAGGRRLFSCQPATPGATTCSQRTPTRWTCCPASGSSPGTPPGSCHGSWKRYDIVMPAVMDPERDLTSLCQLLWIPERDMTSLCQLSWILKEIWRRYTSCHGSWNRYDVVKPAVMAY